MGMLTGHDEYQVNRADSAHEGDVVAQLKHKEVSVRAARSTMPILPHLFCIPFVHMLSIKVLDLEKALRDKICQLLRSTLDVLYLELTIASM